MDTPAVKQTYTAFIKVPKGMQCLMSAVLLEDEGKLVKNGEMNKNKQFVKYNFLQVIFLL
jgi:hypothetical protein